jgi:hypothetical protein
MIKEVKMVKMLDNNSTKSFSIGYVDKNEAMFLLGLLKSVPCSHCVDFFRGCRGGMTLQETAMMSETDYIEKHIQGTEAYICGKLRNIVSLSKAEEQELDNKFEFDFNRRISLLTKKGDDDRKFVLIHDKDEFNSIMKSMERQMIDKVQRDVDKMNQHNAAVVQNMQEQIMCQDETIKEMQTEIQRLRKRKNEIS